MFNDALSYQNIKSSFERCGLWPIDGMKMMSVPRPQDKNDTKTLMTVEEIEQLYNGKQQDALKVAFGDIAIEVWRGFLDTTRGLVLNSEAGMNVAVLKANEVNRKRKELSDREKKIHWAEWEVSLDYQRKISKNERQWVQATSAFISCQTSTSSGSSCCTKTRRWTNPSYFWCAFVVRTGTAVISQISLNIRCPEVRGFSSHFRFQKEWFRKASGWCTSFWNWIWALWNCWRVDRLSIDVKIFLFRLTIVSDITLFEIWAE